MLALVISAMLLQTSLPQTAQVLNINGQRIRIILKGRGSPPVVFESGLGEDANTWAAVQPEVAKFTTTLAFDRPGLGASAPTQAPRDGVTLAGELHVVAHSAGLSAPYLLVGHSLGGAVIQLFADRYPSEVAGLILIDPEDGRIVQRLNGKLSEKQWSDRQSALTRYGPCLQLSSASTMRLWHKLAPKLGRYRDF